MHGATLRRLNRLTEALSVFEKALEENPEDPPLLNNYANLLIDLKNYEKAKMSYEKAKKILYGIKGTEEAKDNARRVYLKHGSRRKRKNG